MKPRNIFAVLASKRKAGSHRKSNKALRKKDKQSGYNSTARISGFYPDYQSSNLCAPTSLY